MTKTGLTTLVLGILILGAGLCLNFLQNQFRQEAKFSGKLQDLLPKPDELPGWQVKYESIAETPEMQKRVLDILDYDDIAYTIYLKGDFRVSIYLAYWRPGRVTPRSVARHTPDVCWTLAGWECRKRIEFEFLRLGEIEFRHTEYRSFTIDGQTEHVAFWHVFGDEIVSYHTGWRPPWYATISDFLRWGNQQKKEQFFLRVSSNRPLEQFGVSDPMRRIISKFSQITRHP